MRIRDFHPVDFDEYEIVQLLCLHTGVQLTDDFAYCGRLACAGRAGDVYASAGAGRDGGFEVRVDGVEFGGPAGERKRDGGDVEVCAGKLEGRRCVVRGEDAGGQGREGQGFLDNYALVRWGDELLRTALCLRGWSRGLGELALLAWGFGLVWLVGGIPFIRRVFVGNVVSFPLPCCLGLALNPFDQWQYIVGGTVYIFPFEFVGVSSCPSIAASPANEDLAIIF